MSRQPLFSIVIPVRDGAADLPRAIAAIRASDLDDYEIIVVDDASTDDTPRAIRAAAPDVAITLARRVDAFAARNVGADHARGRLLFFTDADVTIRPDTLSRLRARFEDPAVASVIGLYAREHPNRDIHSRYKNAWIRFSFTRSPATVAWFFTAVGCVRREVWDAVPHFDPRHENRFGNGDIEFGRRLAAAGYPTSLDRALDVVHHRRFDLAGLLANDARRAYAWTRLGLADATGPSSLVRGRANAGPEFVAGVALAWLSALALAAAPPFAPFFLAAHAAVNLPFYRFSWRELSPAAAIRFAPLMLVDQLAAGAGVAMAVTQLASEWLGALEMAEGAEPAPPIIAEIRRRRSPADPDIQSQ